ncbi:MAG TPA: LysR substrate-binding domain-containing protein [Sphingobium sp.]|uniref:LysR substrate-binding domain-containing protein n=1 Tax=Sphingobium sp. TaxID=1912891 RepID=UPI002ED1D11B
MRHFVAVAEELHFGRAARRLNMAQPPLSQSIRRLELELGFDLLDRTRRSVEMTAAGSVFLEEARRILMQAELARKLAQRAANKTLEVPVSFVGPALYRVLPNLMVRYRDLRPEVTVRLFERTSPDQILGLACGDFEVAFTTTFIGDAAGCETMVVERAPFVAAVPADWPIAQQESVTLAQLAEQPFISSPSRYRSLPDENFGMFKNLGVMPQVVQETSQTYTSLSLVSARLGCTVISATVALVLPRNVRLLPLVGDIGYSHWQMLMVWRPSQLTQAAQEFIAMTKDHIREHPYLIAEQTSAEALASEHLRPHY